MIYIASMGDFEFLEILSMSNETEFVKTEIAKTQLEKTIKN